MIYFQFKPRKFEFRKGRLLSILYSFIFLFLTDLDAQNTKRRTLTQQDYKLWHSLHLDKIADDGKWCSYQLHYNDTDTLFLKNLITDKVLSFAKGKNSRFSAEHFSCIMPNNLLTVLNLRNLKTRSYSNVASYVWAKDYLIYYEKNANEGTLKIVTSEGEILKKVEGVMQYKISPMGDVLAYATQVEKGYKVSLLDLGKIDLAKDIETNVLSPYKNLTWSDKGDAIAFFSEVDSKSRVHYYKLLTKENFKLDCTDRKCFSASRTIQYEQKISFSDDLKCVFFYIQQGVTNKNSEKTGVQVWNAADRYIYPAAQEVAGFSGTMMQVMWNVTTDKLDEVTNAQLPFGGAIGAKNYALSYNPQSYEPQTYYFSLVDYYLTELKTGKQKLIFKGQKNASNYTIVSPSGNYIMYFHDSKWFIYNVVTDTHSDISAGVNTSLSNTESDRKENPDPYPFIGWTTNEKSVLIHDKYDVWEVFPDGAIPRRLTKGREKNLIYRIKPQDKIEQTTSQNWLQIGGVYNLDDSVLLSATAEDYTYSGYCTYNKKSGVRQISYLNKRTTGVLQNKNKNVTVFVGESFENPPEIYLSKKGKTKSIFKSNAHQDNFSWGKVKVVDYLSAEGKKLSGILYYPAGFSDREEYPLIVNIYERQYQYIHLYWTPTMHNETGFNIANLTSKGYFVFLPDIIYDDHKGVGQSALQCVENALKEVAKIPGIDMQKVGLIGHSFGGYQTNYIISNSSKFSCAVAGGAMTDLISANLAVNQGTKIPNFYVVEHGQPRIGGSVSEKKESYINNSPVFFADQIDTPLLSWAGEADTQVDIKQSIELYMALRRLGKQHIMLVYPEEGHALLENENMSDLTHKIEAWFGHFLQNQPIEKWMVSQ